MSEETISPSPIQNETWDIPIESLGWRIINTSKDKSSAQYIAFPDARLVADKMDEVFGYQNWRDHYYLVTDVNPPYAMCELSVWIPERQEWLTKSSVGHAPANEPWKGAESDAFKRAAAKLGIGRNVYSIPPVWGDTEVKFGKVFMPKNYQKVLLRKALQAMMDGAPTSITESAEQFEAEAETTQSISTAAWNKIANKIKTLDEIGKNILREKWDNAYDFAAGPEMTEESFAQLQQWVSELLDEEPVDGVANVVEGLNGTVVEE